jgi:hypothetical protein
VAPDDRRGQRLVVVIDCALLFGLPSALVVRFLALKRWPVFSVIAASAACAQFAGLRLVWGKVSPLEALLLAAPFAASAGIILWWRLAPPA